MNVWCCCLQNNRNNYYQLVDLCSVYSYGLICLSVSAEVKFIGGGVLIIDIYSHQWIYNFSLISNGWFNYKALEKKQGKSTWKLPHIWLWAINHALPPTNRLFFFKCLVSNSYLGIESWALPGLAGSWYNCVMEPLHCTQDWESLPASHL